MLYLCHIPLLWILPLHEFFRGRVLRRLVSGLAFRFSDAVFIAEAAPSVRDSADQFGWRSSLSLFRSIRWAQGAALDLLPMGRGMDWVL
jgi:hypothetical protein